MQKDLDQQIKEFIAGHLEVSLEDMTHETSFEKDLNVDSMDAMDLLVALNEKMGTRIAPEEMEKIQTVGELIAAVKRERC